jgi:type III pantothenate kinase
VISSGTATTVDYVSAAGHFCGGAILPGFDLCAKALHEYTELLPLIRMDSVLDSEMSPAELGRNTQAAITSGLYWGHVGAVKELMRRLMLGGDPHIEPLILLTGGAAPLLYPHLPTIVRHEPHLSLQGLAVVARALDPPRSSAHRD